MNRKMVAASVTMTITALAVAPGGSADASWRHSLKRTTTTTSTTAPAPTTTTSTTAPAPTTTTSTTAPAPTTTTSTTTSGTGSTGTTSHVEMGIFSDLPGMSPAQSVAYRESQLSTTFAIDSHYYAWADSFPLTSEQADVAAGRVPMENWWGVSVDQINNGSQDSLISAEAQRLKSFGHPVFVRLMAEMNGNWYPWSGNPAGFVAAWQRIWNIFHSIGVTNVKWVWAPNADSHPGGTDPTSPNNWTYYYPGDAFVDWVGIDGYNWGYSSGNAWQSFGSVFGPVYTDYASRKPIMIAETSSEEWSSTWGVASASESKAQWITDAASWIKSHPDVEALVWFDTNLSSTGIDWRIDSSAAALAAYANVVNDPYFRRTGSVNGL